MCPKLLTTILTLFLVLGVCVSPVNAKTKLISPLPSPTEIPSPTPEPTIVPRTDFTQTSDSVGGPLEEALKNQKLSALSPFNFIKYAIRSSVASGVPANTIVLLLLLPLSATLIASARQIIGLRGFGIFLPASLSVVFVATGPIVGIGIFLVIVAVSTAFRILVRKFKIHLQYLPRMALQLWAVVLGVLAILFITPYLKWPDLSTVSIFPILILALLAEDFSKVQLGKSARTAITLTSESLFLAFISYIFLTLSTMQKFALTYPELLLVGVAAINLLLGRYVGLRLLEIWRFRRLIKSR